MKTTCTELKCLVCEKTAEVKAGDNEFTDWISIFSIGCIPLSSAKPRLDATVCSTSCLKKAGDVVEEILVTHKNFPCCRKTSVRITCDYCNKSTTEDNQNLSSEINWITVNSANEEEKHFCSPKCNCNYILLHEKR